VGLLAKEAPADFEIVRDGQAQVVKITPREKGKVEGQELDCPRWDFTVKSINQFDNRDLYFYRQEGVFVFGIKYPGNAANAGLRTKDILLEIDGREVKTLEDVKAIHKTALANIESEHRVVLTILRNGLRRQVVLDFARDFEKE
jgi:S1-C subfamily serine protease